MEKSRSIACLLSALLWTGAAAGELAASPQKPKPKPKPAPTPEIVDGAIGLALDAVVQRFDAGNGGFCGVVGVAARGKTLLQKGYGVFDATAQVAMPPDALLDWASVSKPFTAALAMRVIELSHLDEAKRKKLCSKSVASSMKAWKKLSLDDPLSRFFPDAPKDKAEVTLRQLLNHTSGIEAGFKSEWKFDASSRDGLIQHVLRLPMTSKPGAKFDYSNSGYAFVAALLEKLTGVTFEELMREQLFQPAGMKDAFQIGEPSLPIARVPKIARGTGFTDRPKDFVFAYGNALTWGYRGCGGVVASTGDLLAWDRALRDEKFLSKASLEELYRPALDNYALGWTVRDAKGGKRVEHSGGVLGVVTYYLRHLDEDFAVALACSYEPKDHPSKLAEELARVVQEGR